MGLLIVSGPSNAGPGEREQMLEAAAAHLSERGVERDQVVRIDVPGRGGGEAGDGPMRTELEPMIPLLQSGSLFGGLQGLELVDAQNLQKAEVETLVELLKDADPDQVEVVLVSQGALPKAITSVAAERGSTVAVKKIWERQAAKWLDGEAKERGLDLDRGASEALIRKFGSDTASMGRALDQLVEHRGKITAEVVAGRFKNRPDEPLWHITDAISQGKAGTALRRLADFLVHGHPLVYLAALEGMVKKRALAGAAPDEGTFKEWAGGGSDRQLAVLWRQRGAVKESDLRRAQQALVRADRVIKTHPEDVHQVTLERLTVAMCRWFKS